MGQDKRSCAFEFLLTSKTWEPETKFDNEFHDPAHTHANEQNSIRIKVEPKVAIKLDQNGIHIHSEAEKWADQNINHGLSSHTASERSITVELPDLDSNEMIACDPSEVPLISSSTSSNLYSYVCHLCKESFSQQSLLKSHLVTHNICGECGLGCPSKSVLLHHVKSHPAGGVTHICSYCGLDCQNRRDLLHHVKSHQGLPTQICTECGLAFTSRRLLLHHMRSHPGYACDICGKVFKQTKKLTLHKRRCMQNKHTIDHSGQTQDMATSRKRTMVPKMRTPCKEYLLVSKTWESVDEFRSRFDCNIWPMQMNIEQSSRLADGEPIDNLMEPGIFLNNTVDRTASFGQKSNSEGGGSMKLDLQDSHGAMSSALLTNNLYKCRVCKDSFSESSLLKSHLLTHNVCADCGLACPNKSVLIDHMKCHTGHVCRICGETFAESNSLLKHYRFHISNPFSCDICHKTFSRKSALIDHDGVHKKDDKYHCIYEHCRWSCTNRIDLKSHIKQHSGCLAINRNNNYITKDAVTTNSKPVVFDNVNKCTICPKTSKHAHLKSHLLTDNMCGECGLACSNRSVLLHHMKSHPGAKPYQCKHCKESFESWSNLNSHMQGCIWLRISLISGSHKIFPA